PLSLLVRTERSLRLSSVKCPSRPGYVSARSGCPSTGIRRGEPSAENTHCPQMTERSPGTPRGVSRLPAATIPFARHFDLSFRNASMKRLPSLIVSRKSQTPPLPSCAHELAV